MAEARAPGRARQVRRLAREEFRERVGVLEFALGPEYGVSLVVADRAGLPLERVEASLSGPFDRQALTDVEGRVTFDELGGDGVSLRLQREGFLEQEVVFAAERPQHAHRAVVLERELPPILVRLVLDEALAATLPPDYTGYIRLERLDETGDVRRVQYASSAESGVHRIVPERTGTYRACLGEGERGRSESFYYDGLTAVEVEIHLRLEAPYLAGHVQSAATGEPIAGVPVVAVFASRDGGLWRRYQSINGFPFPLARGVNGPGNARYSSGLTRDDGTFLIDLLLPEGPGWTDASTPNPMVEVYAGSGELGWSPLWAAEVLPTTVVDDLVLELEPCGAIEGRVRSPTERGGDREVVAAYDGRRVAVETVAGNDGAYRLDGLPPGSYLVLPVGPKRVGAHGGGWGRGAEAFLPPPHEFFEFPHRVEPGETLRVDLDLARDGLGRIEATMPTGVEAEQVAYGRVIGGRRHGAACLGGQEDVHSPDWSLRDHHLHPGSYEVWLQDRDGRRLADTAVTVRRAEVSRAVLVAPAAAFNVPVVGLAAERDAGADVGDDDGRVEVVRVEVFDATAPDPERPWYEWGGYRVSELPGALRIAGLPGRRVRALLYAPGRPETWSNEVFLPAGGEGTAQPVVFPRGVALRLELVWPQARAPSDPVAYESLRVWVLDSDTGRPVRVGVRPDAEKPASVLHLDALQRGRYELYVEAPGVRAAFAEFAIEDEAEPPVIRLELRAEE